MNDISKPNYELKFDIKYIDFIKVLPPYDGYYQRIFIPSLVKLNEEIYLYCVRAELSYKASNKFIPGNDKMCKVGNIGINYWWNHWYSRLGVSITKFLYYNHKSGTYIPINVVINEKFITKNQDAIDGNDHRLVKINNKIILHSTDLKEIYEVIPLIEKKEIILKKILSLYITGKNLQIINIRESKLEIDVDYLDWFYREGVAIIKNKSRYYIQYQNFKLDGNGSHIPGKFWRGDPKLIEKYENEITSYDLNPELYELDSIYIKKIEKQKKTVKTFTIEYANYQKEINNINVDKEFFKSNYGKIPLLSFTSPHIKIDNYIDYGTLLLGVGHIKIHSDDIRYLYLENSNIDLFRKNLYNDMNKYFGERYIKHFGSTPVPYCKGYIYLLYFYILYNNEQKMKMSNAYLPLLLDKKEPDSEFDKDYKFSLIFPSGLERGDDNDIIITAGEGDFYSVILKFDLHEVIKLCFHDVQNLNMEYYKYFIIAKNNNVTYIGERLNGIIEQINVDTIKTQNGGDLFYKKYEINKNKYKSLSRSE